MNHTELTRRTLHELNSLEAHLDAHEFEGVRKRDIAGLAGVGAASFAGGRYGGKAIQGYQSARAMHATPGIMGMQQVSRGSALRHGLQGAGAAARGDMASAANYAQGRYGAAKEGVKGGVMRGKDFLSASLRKILSRGKA